MLTFIEATIFDILAGEPFTAPQTLWIDLLVDAPLGVALGFGLETPGLMLRKPRPRNASILTRSMPTTVRVVGIFVAVCLLVLAQHGDPHFGSAAVASTMAVTAFAACRSVGGSESRSPTGGIVTVSTFNSRQMNWISLLEVVLLILVVGLDLLSTWLVTTGMTWTQWSLSPAPA